MGVETFGLLFPPHNPHAGLVFTADSHPNFLYVEMPRQEVDFWMNAIRPQPDRRELMANGLKFTGYSTGVGNAFEERACSIEGHNAAVTMLSSNPDLKAFAKSRVRAHTENLRMLLQNPSMNTRYNFLDMNLAEKLFPEETNCGSVLAQTDQASSSVNMAAMAFIGGVTTAAFAFVAHLQFKKKTALAEQDSLHSAM